MIDRLYRSEQRVVLAALLLIAALAWLYVLTGAGTGMSPAAMTTWQFPPPVPSIQMPGPWNATYAAIMVMMWWTMMIAMMLPSAAPIALLYAAVDAKSRREDPTHGRAGGTEALVAGYLTAWFVFSVAATLFQWTLEVAGILHGLLMWSTSATLSAALLIAAGLYQLTPVKAACLDHCRSPVHYLSSHWRPGRSGAWRMGIEHGIYCVGCCWLLMGLLFVGGTMNLVWIAGLSILVLIEKLLPGGVWFGRVTGVVLMATGLAVAVRAAS